MHIKHALYVFEHTFLAFVGNLFPSCPWKINRKSSSRWISQLISCTARQLHLQEPSCSHGSSQRSEEARPTVPEWGNMGIENTNSVNNSGLPLHFRKVQEVQNCRKQWGAGTFWAFHTLSWCYRWVEPPQSRKTFLCQTQTKPGVT